MDIEATEGFDEPAASRALALREAPSPAPGAAGPRPLAPFVTQLFACEARLESFRRHRRAGPARASASYEASDHVDGVAAARFERLL